MTAPVIPKYEIGPFDAEHGLIQWGGSLPGGEEWSNSLRMRNPAEALFPQSAALAMSPPIVAAIKAWHGRSTTQISAQCKLNFVKFNAIQTNGKYQAANTNEVVFADISGGSPAVLPPNQIALVVTADTGVSRGPAHRGRFFSPLPAIQVDATDGLIPIANRTDVKASAALLLAALNAVYAGQKIVVMSRKKYFPATRAVTVFNVGRVLDTQRRRRRSLPELYA